MKNIEVSGKTVDDAVNEALNKLNLSRSEVEVEVIEEANKGFLGIFGQKDAKVRVSKKIDSFEVGAEFLKNTLSSMGLNADIKSSKDENDYIKFDIYCDNPGIIIGKRGETLDSLQYLTNLVINKKLNDEKCKVILDVEGYRQKREQTLIDLAHKLSSKVKENKKNIVLEPMNPYERRIIHTTLQSDSQVTTYSEGEEPYRKVVITYKNK